MMPVSLFDEAARVGLAVILNSLWQGVVIAFVAWAVLRVFSRANAATRYATWSFALVAMIVIPVLTSLPRVTVEQAAPAHVKIIAGRTSAQQLPAPPAVPQQPAAQTAALSRLQGFSVPQLRLTTPLALAIFGIWLLAALVVLGRLIVAIVWLERLKSDSLPLDVAYRDQMPQWNAALKDFRDVRLCVSDAIEVPVAIGLFDAMILLPKHLVQSLEPEEIDQIALHELGHLRRNDDWTNALQRVACSLLFFSPAAWFVSRQLDIEREVACDDYVLQATGAAKSYAFCLTRIAEVTSWPHRGVAAPGVFITRRNISIRIERLLRTGRTIGSAISPAIAASVVVALVLVSVLVRTMTPSVAYTLPAPANDHNDTIQTAVVKVIESPAPVRVKHTVTNEKPTSHTVQQHTRPGTGVGTAVGTAVGSTVGSVVGATVASAVNTAMHAAALQQTANERQMEAQSKQIAAQARQQVADALKMAKLTSSDMKDFCADCDYRHADLNGHDFSNKNLNGANFEGAKLRGARFDNAHLVGTNFSRADLRDASFANANLVGCNLSRAQLGGTNFANARLVGCNFEAQNLSPQQARMFLMSCTSCNFENADLHGMDVHNIHLTGTNLAGANLAGANLSGTKVSGVNFEGANLSHVKIEGATFSGCNFDGADLSGVDMSSASFFGSNLSSRAR